MFTTLKLKNSYRLLVLDIWLQCNHWSRGTWTHFCWWAPILLHWRADKRIAWVLWVRTSVATFNPSSSVTLVFLDFIITTYDSCSSVLHTLVFLYFYCWTPFIFSFKKKKKKKENKFINKLKEKEEICTHRSNLRMRWTIISSSNS